MDSRLLSFCFLFGAVFGKNDFTNEVIVTSADVVDGKIENIGKAGESYRLYAIASIGAEDPLVKQVSITDSKGKTFKLTDLFGKKDAYFLSETNIVTGPVKVTDPTGNIQNRKRSVAYRLTYTIYLVSTKVPALPVADVVSSFPRGLLYSNDYNAKEVSGMTILSADAHFTLRMFQFTTDSAYVIPRGYDVQSSNLADSVIDLTRENAYESYITISGPIATVLNKDSKLGQFTIGFDPASTSDNLKSPSSLSLLSPNWLSLDESYSTSYTKYTEAFVRQFNFDKDTLLDFSISASALKNGESVSLQITNDKGEQKQWTYNPSTKGEIRDSVYGSDLHLSVAVNSLDTPSAYPRFLVKVNSGGTAPNTDSTSKTTTPTLPPTTSVAVSMSLLMAILLPMMVTVQQ